MTSASFSSYFFRQQVDFVNNFMKALSHFDEWVLSSLLTLVSGKCTGACSFRDFCLKTLSTDAHMSEQTSSKLCCEVWDGSLQ